MFSNFKLPKVNIKNAIALITVLGILSIVWGLMIITVPAGNKTLIDVAFGIMVRSAWDPIYRAMYPQKKELEPNSTMKSEETTTNKPQ